MRKSKNKVEQTTKLLEGSKGGGGGGKGGQSEGAKEAPNTLQSKSTVRVVEALSEGPIGGFINTQALLNSIYFDDTPVMGPNGSTNIPEVLMRANYGAHVQEVLIGFALAETEYGVGVTLDTTGTIRLINSGVDVVRVTVQFPNGLSQTDTKTGNTDGFGVGLEIYAYSDDGGSAFYYREVSGKTVRPYEEAWDIPRPTGNETTNWYIRVRRTSAPQGSSYIQDAVAWTRYTEIENDTSETATYPDVAHVGLEIDAKATGSQIPRRSYFLKGLLIKVPSNFTAMTVNDFGVITYGTYSGNWDGTFKPFLELCNDPVWICYDLLTNTRYGLGNEIDPNTIDKFSFYDAAKYNSQVITYQYLNNMGVPETIAEPRYTFNGPIQTQEQAFKVVQAVASTCRGSIYAGAGGITFLQDRPKESVGTITNASVVDGVFTYSGSELGERYTVVKVTFNDSTDRYLPNVIEYEDPVMIDRFGYNVSEVAAFGVTSPGQAFRMGKWIVETTCNQTESVQFTMSFNSAFFGIGEVVSIADNNYVTTDMGGIIDNVLVNGLNTDIYVDRVVLNSARVLQFIDKYTAKSVKVPILSMLPQTNGNTIVKISGTTTQPAVDTPYLAYDVIEPREWVITGVTENVGIYSYTGVAYDYTKFSRVETGVAANKPRYSDLTGFQSSPVTNIQFRIETYLTSVGGLERRLIVSWDQSKDELHDYYRLKWRKDKGEYTVLDKLGASTAQIEFARPGVYDVSVFSISQRGATSPETKTSYTVTDTGFNSISAVQNIRFKGYAPTVNLYNDLAITVEWDPPLSVPVGTALKDYRVDLVTSVPSIPGDNAYYTEYVPLNSGIGFPPSFLLTQSKIRAQGSLKRESTMIVYPRDAQNLLTSNTAGTKVVTNPPPAALAGISIDPQIYFFTINHTLPQETDFRDVIILVSKTSPCEIKRENIAKRDAGASHIIEGTPQTTYYLRIAAADNFNDEITELNWSSEFSVTTLAASYPPPDTPANLVVTSAINATDPSIADVHVTWDAVSNSTGYTVRVERTSDSTYATVLGVSYFPTSTPLLDFSYVPGAYTRISVRAENANGNSAFTANSNQRIAINTASAGNITGLVTTPMVNGLEVVWDAISNPNLDHYTAAMDPTDSGVAPPVTPMRTIQTISPQAIYGNLSPGTTYYVWVRTVSSSNVFGPWAKTQGVPVGSVAGIPDGSITTPKLADGAVTDIKVLDGAIKNAKLAVNAVTSDKVALGAITETKIADDAITTPKIAALAVTANELAANSVVAGKIAADAVTAGAIAADSIAADDIQAGAVTAGKLAANSVVAVNISANAVTAGKIAADAVTAVTIKAGEVIAGKLGVDSVVANNIAAGAITAAKITAATITGDKIAANTITADNLKANSIVVGNANSSGEIVTIKNGYINAPMIQANSIIVGAAPANVTIANGYITGTHIAADTITGDKISTASIIVRDTAQMNNLVVTGAKIAGLSVGTGHIVDGNITNAKIGNLEVDTIKIKNGSITDLQILTNRFAAVGIGLGGSYSFWTGSFLAAAPTNIGGPFNAVINWYIYYDISNGSYQYTNRYETFRFYLQYYEPSNGTWNNVGLTTGIDGWDNSLYSGHTGSFALNNTFYQGYVVGPVYPGVNYRVAGALYNYSIAQNTYMTGQNMAARGISATIQYAMR